MVVIYKIKNPEFRDKMAAFDYDWTLVNPQNGKTFPKDVNDWEWYSPCVPQKVQEYYQKGYMIVIFTNQSKTWKHDQIKMVSSKLGVPVHIVVATEKADYKPNNISFHTLFAGNPDIDLKKSFFVGDAMGRKSDWNDSDLEFAKNIGVKPLTPEEVFMNISDFTVHDVPLSSKPEVVIMMGYPGSGKSTIAKKLASKKSPIKYTWIPRDVFKTPAKMRKAAKPLVENGESVIFDATNSSAKSRREYTKFAEKYSYPVRCVYVSTPLDVAYKRNKARPDDQQVPKIAYNMYKKHFEAPKKSEGFTLYEIPFKNDFCLKPSKLDRVMANKDNTNYDFVSKHVNKLILSEDDYELADKKLEDFEKLAEKVTQAILKHFEKDLKKKISKSKKMAKKKSKKTGPKRPKNAYMWFCAEHRKDVKQELVDSGDYDKVGVTDVSKELGKRWRELEDDDKEKYTQQAADDKERYAKEVADLKEDDEADDE